jgi:hypothetical protein
VFDGVNEGKQLGMFVGDDDGMLLDGCDVGRVVGKLEGTLLGVFEGVSVG